MKAARDLSNEFVEMVQANEGIIYKISRAYAIDDEDQKDLYQEIVFQLWKSFPSFRGDAKISTWLYRIALNTSIAFLNKRKKNALTTGINFELLNRPEDREEGILEEQIQQLYTYIQELNLVERGIILLYLEGKPYDEIASITGFSNTNVGTRLARIKKKLKTKVKK